MNPNPWAADYDVPTMPDVSDAISPAALLVLAGGRGRRMGRPKGDLQIDRSPILEYLMNRWQWPGEAILITAPGREHPPGWRRFTREAVDLIEGEGPLRGILTGLDAMVDSDRGIFVTVDMPGVGSAQLQFLASQWLPDDVGLMLQTAAQPEQFPMMLHPSMRQSISHLLITGERRVAAIRDLPGVRTIAAPVDWPARIWTNLNTPADAQRFATGREAGE